MQCLIARHASSAMRGGGGGGGGGGQCFAETVSLGWTRSAIPAVFPQTPRPYSPRKSKAVIGLHINVVLVN